jgi:hypothetical protein
MQIEILEDKEEYKRLHELVFKQSDITVPDVVFIGRNSSGRTVGFVSGFWNSDDHFYIQWAGVLPAYQKRGYLRYFSAILKDDVTYDMAVRNTNVVTLKTVLSVGFIPIGIIQKDLKLYIQVQRGVRNG